MTERTVDRPPDPKILLAFVEEQAKASCCCALLARFDLAPDNPARVCVSCRARIVLGWPTRTELGKAVDAYLKKIGVVLLVEDGKVLGIVIERERS